MLAKRIEVRKLSKLGCNIHKLKFLIRTASNAVHQRPALPSKKIPLTRSAHSIGHARSEHTCQALKLQEKSESSLAFARSHSRLALGNPTMRVAQAEEHAHPHRRSVHSEVIRGSRSAHPPMAASVQNPASAFETASSTTIVDRNEGPCKRTLRSQHKEQKIVPTYLKLVEECDSDTSVTSQTRSRRRGGRSMQQQSLDADRVIFHRHCIADEPPKSKTVHHIQFGRRDRRVVNDFQSQLEEARLQQSLNLFSEKAQTSAARKGSISVHPKFQLVKPPSPPPRSPAPTQKELREARFGHTLNSLTEQRLFKLANLCTQDLNKFNIEDELHVQAKLLAKQKAEKLKAEQQKLAEAAEKAEQAYVALAFGRRKNERQFTAQNEDQQVDEEKLEAAQTVARQDSTASNWKQANVAANNATATPTGSTTPTPTPSNANSTTNASISASATSASNCSNPSEATVKTPNFNTSENIYRKFLQGEEKGEIVEIEAPRFDELYYRETRDTLSKNYSQTWIEYPEPLKNLIPNEVRLVPPPFTKRPKNERPATAKAWGEVDESSCKF